MNKVILVGNLTRNTELKYSNAGVAIVKTAIAVTRKFTSNGQKKEEVAFVDLTFFGRAAEVAHKYLHKGKKVLIEGRLVQETWTNQEGQNRSKLSVVVDSMEMLGEPPMNENQETYKG